MPNCCLEAEGSADTEATEPNRCLTVASRLKEVPKQSRNTNAKADMGGSPGLAKCCRGGGRRGLVGQLRRVSAVSVGRAWSSFCHDLAGSYLSERKK
jgi:hypothetical protein